MESEKAKTDHVQGKEETIIAVPKEVREGFQRRDTPSRFISRTKKRGMFGTEEMDVRRHRDRCC